jgi:predicted phosphate transport protein (TIGR00153 family)
MSLNSLISWLKPRELVFFDLLEASAANLLKSAELFEKEFVAEALPAHWESMRRRMKDLEHVGDELTHDIVDRLNKTFVTPLEREDILALAHALDDVVDCLDGVCERLVLYKVTRTMPLAQELGRLVVKGAEELVPLINCLRNMSDQKGITRRIQYCNELENQADAVFHAALAEIFADPKDPIELIKWKEILALLEDATDRIELVSKVVSSTVMRNA